MTVLSRLFVVYGQPDSQDPDAYVAECNRVLARYTPAIQERAVSIVLDTHRRRGWPLPSEFALACDEAARQIAPRCIVPSQPSAPPPPPPTPDQIERAARLMEIFRRNMAANVLPPERPARSPYAGTQRPEFEAMRRDVRSPASALHRTPAASEEGKP